MEHYGKKKQVYHGIVIPFVVIILMPIVCFFIVYSQIIKYSNLPHEVIMNICLGIAGICGFCFCMICMLSGFVHDIFLAWIRRIKETIAYFPPFSKDAFKWYFYNFIYDGGPILWIFLFIMVVYIIIGAYNITAFCNWYYLNK